MRSASLQRSLPRLPPVSSLHAPSNAFLAAATCIPHVRRRTSHTQEDFIGYTYGDVYILLGGLVNAADDLLGGRVDDLEFLAVDTLDELVVNEETSGLGVFTAVRGGELEGSHD